MAQEAGFGGALKSAAGFSDFLRGINETGDPGLTGGANIDIEKLSGDVEALRQLGSGLGASEAVGGILDRFKSFTEGGGRGVIDPEVSLATESNLRQQSNVLKAIQSQASLLGPGATSALGEAQGRALTDFGIARSNIPTEIRDKFFKQFTPLLQSALGTEAGLKQATVGAEQSTQAFDLGISNQALQNALSFGPIEAGRFGQQKELSNIAAQAQIESARIANQSDKGGAVAGAAGQVAGSLILASATSDFRLKDQVDLIDSKEALEIIRQIHGFRWDWLDGSGSDFGVIAQEVAKVFPEAVVCDNPDGILRIKYPALVGLLIAATGELAKQLDDLKQESKEKSNATE